MKKILEYIKGSNCIKCWLYHKTIRKQDINGDIETYETKNKTDKAFIDFLYRFKSHIRVQKEKYISSDSNYKQFPFDSKRKTMTTFVENKEFHRGYRLFSKGGAENICAFRKIIEHQIQVMWKNGRWYSYEDKGIYKRI